MLKSKHRIGRKYFTEVMKGGAKTSTPLFFIRYKKNSNDQKLFKCSVVVSKKVASKAVDRNNFRRRAYYAIGEIIKDPHTSAGIYSVIFFVKFNLKKISFSDLKSDVRKVFRMITS